MELRMKDQQLPRVSFSHNNGKGTSAQISPAKYIPNFNSIISAKISLVKATYWSSPNAREKVFYIV
jgi:hypothetical protein